MGSERKCVIAGSRWLQRHRDAWRPASEIIVKLGGYGWLVPGLASNEPRSAAGVPVAPDSKNKKGGLPAESIPHWPRPMRLPCRPLGQLGRLVPLGCGAPAGSCGDSAALRPADPHTPGRSEP